MQDALLISALFIKALIAASGADVSRGEERTDTTLPQRPLVLVLFSTHATTSNVSMDN